MFVSSFAPPPRMLVFGAIDFAAAVARIGAFLGYHVTVCDARPVFATAEAVPRRRRGGRRLAAPLPGGRGRRGRVDGRTVICVLTHDPKFDVPVLEVALRLPVAYVGAMGSPPHPRRPAGAAARGGADRGGAGPAALADRPRPGRPHPGGDRGQHRRRDRRAALGRHRRAAVRRGRSHPPRGPAGPLTRSAARKRAEVGLNHVGAGAAARVDLDAVASRPGAHLGRTGRLHPARAASRHFRSRARSRRGTGGGAASRGAAFGGGSAASPAAAGPSGAAPWPRTRAPGPWRSPCRGRRGPPGPGAAAAGPPRPGRRAAARAAARRSRSRATRPARRPSGRTARLLGPVPAGRQQLGAGQTAPVQDRERVRVEQLGQQEADRGGMLAGVAPVRAGTRPGSAGARTGTATGPAGPAPARCPRASVRPAARR